MVWVLVIHMVGVIEAILVTDFLLGAGGNCVPILHIKSKEETYVMIFSHLCHVQVTGILLLCNRLDSGWNISDHAGPYKWHHMIPTDEQPGAATVLSNVRCDFGHRVCNFPDTVASHRLVVGERTDRFEWGGCN
jgi:hypothetical protein